MKKKEFYHSIRWSDESKFNLFGSDGRQIVWRQPHQSMKQQCLKPTVKYGGGSVIVWGCMAANGVGVTIKRWSVLMFVDKREGAGYRHPR